MERANGQEMDLKNSLEVWAGSRRKGCWSQHKSTRPLISLGGCPVLGSVPEAHAVLRLYHHMTLGTVARPDSDVCLFLHPLIRPSPPMWGCGVPIADPRSPSLSQGSGTITSYSLLVGLFAKHAHFFHHKMQWGQFMLLSHD